MVMAVVIMIMTMTIVIVGVCMNVVRGRFVHAVRSQRRRYFVFMFLERAAEGRYTIAI